MGEFVRGSNGGVNVITTVFMFLWGLGPALAQQEYCQTSRGNVGNGYHYEMWIQQGTPGSACLTVYEDDASFKTEWDLDGYGFVSRVGLLFDQTRTAEEIGWITSDYEFKKSGDGQAWMGVYGWTVDPLKEYYIIEDWNGWRPQFDQVATITVDGGEYDVYTDMRIEKPSIQGTQTFEQWFSVRREPRQSGHISISEHFEKWIALGMEVGNLYEAKLKVEGFNGSGVIDFTTATVQVGTRPDTSLSITDRQSGWAFLMDGKPKGRLFFFNANGAKIRSVRLNGIRSAPSPAADLPSGRYILRFTSGKSSFNRILHIP